MFYWTSKSSISVEREVFSRPETAKGGDFQVCVRAWYTFWSGVGFRSLIYFSYIYICECYCGQTRNPRSDIIIIPTIQLNT